jgi:hypothetical protein
MGQDCPLALCRPAEAPAHAGAEHENYLLNHSPLRPRGKVASPFAPLRTALSEAKRLSSSAGSTISDQGGQNPEVWILDRSEITQNDHGAQLRAAAVRVWPKVETFARRELSGSSLAGETSLA